MNIQEQIDQGLIKREERFSITGQAYHTYVPTQDRSLEQEDPAGAQDDTVTNDADGRRDAAEETKTSLQAEAPSRPLLAGRMVANAMPPSHIGGKVVEWEVSVDWAPMTTVNGETHYAETSSDIRSSTHIISWALRSGGPFSGLSPYTWGLSVQTDRGPWYKFGRNYNYAFTDESGDTYTLTTYRDGAHFLDYNSDKPTIKRVKCWY